MNIWEGTMKRRYLVILLILLSIVSIFVGVKEVKILDLMNLDKDEFEIIILSRIPRLVSTILAGMGMSICGAIMQQISRNKFVSPSTAATVDSAKLGILVSIMLFNSSGTFTKMFISFIFSVGGTFLFMQILKKIKHKGSIFIPLVGLMFGSIIDSITTFFAYKYDLVQNISSWLHGDFSMVIKGRYELLYLSIPLVILAFLYANKFTVVGMGEDFAVNLGLNYKSVVNIGIIIVALVTSVVVITVGKIPFLGLIVPNIVAIYKGDNMKNSISYITLFGAIFLLICDIIGRVIIYPYEISVGLTVGVIGSSIFLYLLFRRYNYES